MVRHPWLTGDELLAHARELPRPRRAQPLEQRRHAAGDRRRGREQGVGPGGALRALGVGRADVLAFGDMPNDLAMLEWAGRSVAVANAHVEVHRDRRRGDRVQ